MKNSTILIIRGLIMTSSVALLMYLRGLYLLSSRTSSPSSSQSSSPSNINKEKDTKTKSDTSSSQSKSSLLVVTRVHTMASTTMPDPIKVISFIHSAVHYSSHILICIGSENYIDIQSYIDTIRGLLEKANEEGIHIVNMDHIHFLAVSPWGYFTTALNAALQYAQDKQFKYMAFQVDNSNYIIHATIVFDEHIVDIYHLSFQYCHVL